MSKTLVVIATFKNKINLSNNHHNYTTKKNSNKIVIVIMWMGTKYNDNIQIIKKTYYKHNV